MPQVFVAMGSNIAPKHHLAVALQELRSRFGHVASSSVYETEPWGVVRQPRFLNLVVSFFSEAEPLAVLHELQQIEMDHGRRRTIKNGPRTIDLDLLLHGDFLVDHPELQIPHPGLLERDFMLVPLVELAPDVVHPAQRTPLAQMRHLVRFHQIIKQMEVPEWDQSI